MTCGVKFLPSFRSNLILSAICQIILCYLLIPVPAWSSAYRCEDSSGVTVLTDSPSQLDNCALIQSDLPQSHPPPISNSALSQQPMGASIKKMEDPEEQNEDAFEIEYEEENDLDSTEEKFNVTVPVEALGGSLIVPVELNGERTVQLILDTGATMTVLSTEVAVELGIMSDPRSQITTVKTAGGPIQVTMTQIETITVGGARAQNVAVAIHDLPDGPDGIEGLLGMSFLNHFLVTLDTNQGQLHLRRR